MLALTFAILRDRRAMGLTLLFGAVMPIGDALVILRNSPAPLTYLPLHFGEAVGCWVLAFIFLDRLRRRERRDLYSLKPKFSNLGLLLG
jgi:hypothetical protein